MSQEGSGGFDVNEIGVRAKQILAEKLNFPDFVVTRILQDVIPSNRRYVFRVDAQVEGEPNIAHSVYLDEEGEIEDLLALAKAEEYAFFSDRININMDALIGRQALEERTVTIEPNDNDLILEFGDVFEEKITVTIGAGGIKPRIDIYFLADTTGSMVSALDGVKTSINLIIDRLAAEGVDVEYGVGNYRDFPGPAANAFIHQLPLTSNLDRVRAEVDSWIARGGGDGSEAQLYALDRLAEPPLGTIGWRTESKKIIVWFGDEPGHEPICQNISGLPYDIDIVSVVARILDENITIIAVDTDTGTEGLNGDPQASATDYEGQCAQITGRPGQADLLTFLTRSGTVIVGVDTTEIVNRVLEQVENAVPIIDTVTLDPSGDAERFVTSISPSRHGPFSGAEGQELEFDVTFVGGVDCREDRDQNYSGQIAVKIGNDVKAIKTVLVTVPKCKPMIVGEPSSVAYDSPYRNGDKLHVYARAKNDQLYECFWDPVKREWIWVDRGLPLSHMRIQTLFAVEEFHDHGANVIHVFAIMQPLAGGRIPGPLFFYDFEGDPDSNNWSWNSIPLDPQVAAGIPNIGAIDFRRGSVPTDSDDRLFPTVDSVIAFMVGSNDQLYSHEFGFRRQSGTQSRHGMPSGAPLKALRPRGGNKFGTGPEGFVVGNDNNLYVRTATQRWGSLGWTWLNLGQIAFDPEIVKGPAAAFLRYKGYWTFVVDSQNRLLVNHWNDTLQDPGNWEYIAHPPEANFESFDYQIEAKVFPAEYANRHLAQVFVFLVIDGELWTSFGDGKPGNWNWLNLGSPPELQISSTPSPTTYRDPIQGNELLYCFVRGSDDHLWVHVWDGDQQRSWHDLSDIGSGP